MKDRERTQIIEYKDVTFLLKIIGDEKSILYFKDREESVML